MCDTTYQMKVFVVIFPFLQSQIELKRKILWPFMQIHQIDAKLFHEMQICKYINNTDLQFYNKKMFKLKFKYSNFFYF